jgi:hypothetical protein
MTYLKGSQGATDLKRQTSSQSTTSGTFQDSSDIVFTIGAGEEWFFHGYLGTTGNGQMTLAGTGTVTGVWFEGVSTSPVSLGTNIGGSGLREMRGKLLGGASGGTFKLQFRSGNPGIDSASPSTDSFVTLVRKA